METSFLTPFYGLYCLINALNIVENAHLTYTLFYAQNMLQWMKRHDIKRKMYQRRLLDSYLKNDMWQWFRMTSTQTNHSQEQHHHPDYEWSGEAEKRTIKLINFETDRIKCLFIVAKRLPLKVLVKHDCLVVVEIV